MYRYSYSFLFLLFIVFSGCSVIGNWSKLWTLKKYSGAQAAIGRDIADSDRRFELLRNDVQNGKVIVGIDRRTIVARYGEPVAVMAVKSDSKAIEKLLYRYAAQYFNSDKVYLYFDDMSRLVSWEYKVRQ